MFCQIVDDGFFGIMVFEEFGGVGFGMIEMVLFMEGIVNYGILFLMMVVGLIMLLVYIVSYGSEFYKKELLLVVCCGDIQFCFVIIELGVGLNMMKVMILVKCNGNWFSLLGEKIFIIGVEVFDYCFVVVCIKLYIEVSCKIDGFILFVVDLKKKGVDKQWVKILIFLFEEQWILFFDEVDLGFEDIVGEVDEGFLIFFDSFNFECIIFVVLCCGIGCFVLNKGVSYVFECNVFG